MNLLGRGDRAHVAGYVLNKFRGDVSLLEPALEKSAAGQNVLFSALFP
jgi:cobyric acid synthase